MRKTARVSWANIFRGILLALTLELPWPGSLGWLWEAVNWVSFAMFAGGGATLIVCGLVNAARTARGEGAEERAPGRALRERREEQRAGAPWAAWRQALAAGTASVNGVPVRPGKVLVRASDTCDECWEPLDVAWVQRGFPRLCTACRTHGMPGYHEPQPHTGSCDGCGTTVRCTRAGTAHMHFCYGCAYSH